MTRTPADEPRQYQLQLPDYGTIGDDHSIWMWCEELARVRALVPGQTAYFVRFRTGMGVNHVDVRRVDGIQQETGS